MYRVRLPRGALLKGAALAVGAGTVLGVVALAVLAVVGLGFGSLIVPWGPVSRAVSLVLFAPVLWFVAVVMVVFMYWWAFAVVLAAEALTAYRLSRGNVDRVSRLGFAGVFLMGMILGTLWRGLILGLFRGSLGCVNHV